MKQIALISLPYLPDYMRNARCDFVSLSHTQWYPLWLGFLGAFLEKKGYEICFIDAPAAGLSFYDVCKSLDEFKPEFLVIYTGRLSEDADIKYTEKLQKKFGIEAVFVGPYFSIDPKKTLTKSKTVKFGVAGELEYPVWELLEGKKLSLIKNLVYKKNKIILNELRPYLTTKQLDKIPFVTEFFSRHLNLKNYKAPSEYYPFIDTMTGRGCVWGRCSYCLWVQSFVKGSIYNRRSLGNVIEEMKYIEKHLPMVKSIMIQDDTFPQNRAAEFSQSLLKNKIKLRWSCYARANIDLKTLKLMKRAGCLNLHVGFESASDKILKAVDKGIAVDQMREFAFNVHKAKLSMHADFAFGFPGESGKTVRKTIDFAKEIKPDTAQFQIMIPFEGTKFYTDLKKNKNPDKLTERELSNSAKDAYKEFYFSWNYLKRVLRHPIQHFVMRFDTYVKAIPAVFWKKWIK